MLLNIYCVYDRKARTFSDMFLSPNHGTAIRDLNYMVQHNPVKQHIRDDLELYCIGTFNGADGKLEAREPEFISGVNADEE